MSSGRRAAKTTRTSNTVNLTFQKGKKKKKKEKKEKKDRRRKKKSEYEVAEGITTPSKEQLPPSQAATPAAYKLPVCTH